MTSNGLAAWQPPEQTKVMQGPGAPDLRRDAIRNDTDEGKAAMRQERDRQRQEYEAAWDKVPEW